MIGKIAENLRSSLRPYSFHASARAGWSEILKKFKRENPLGEILLPAYIGWSANEGSGIFDPVKESGIAYNFYNITADFCIDVQDLKSKAKDNVLVLLVHYFGFPDSNYIKIAEWLGENHIPFVEDCAHALLSDHVGGICGRKGDYSFYSLHKLLPVKGGGMIRANSANEAIVGQDINYNDIWNYDFFEIYQKRRANYTFIADGLKKLSNVKLLYPILVQGVGPQTLPVLINGDRNEIYHEMNNQGFGMVSLYHTMIEEISIEKYPDSHYLASHIINFPVHQDVTNEDLVQLLSRFSKLYS